MWGVCTHRYVDTTMSFASYSGQEIYAHAILWGHHATECSEEKPMKCFVAILKYLLTFITKISKWLHVWSFF